MMELLGKLFGFSGTELSAEELENGTIVDVRTRSEFQRGHLTNCINIPLQELDAAMDRFREMSAPVILCCATGNRSGMAARRLNSAGVKAINAGGWRSLAKQLEK